MVLSQTFSGIGRVAYPIGARTQLRDLVAEVDEYFQHGISVKPGDVVFDVGANLGVFALHACMKAGGPLRLYCFEPIPELFRTLERNVAGHAYSRAARLFNVGLTRMGGPKDAIFHYFKRLPCDTTQHLDEKMHEFEAFFDAQGARARRALGVAGGAADGALRALPRNPVGRWLFNRAIGATPLRAPLVTLAQVVEREGVETIDLLKVDVEGAEMDVVLGVGPKVWPRVRQVVLEGHDIDGRLAALRALLAEAGFDHVVSEVPPLAVERGLNNFVLCARRTKTAPTAS